MSHEAKKKDAGEGFLEQQLVVFKVAGEEFGVDINEVKEIIRWEEVTRIPNCESYIKGVINLRGNIIVVNDLAMKLGLPSKTVDDDTRILVVEVGDNQTVGMVVDSATEVLRLSGDKIRAAPSMVTSNIDTNYIEGVGVLDEKRLLTLLDLSKVLESQDYGKILEAQRCAEQHLQSHESQEDEEPNVTEIPLQQDDQLSRSPSPNQERQETPEQVATSLKTNPPESSPEDQSGQSKGSSKSAKKKKI